MKIRSQCAFAFAYAYFYLFTALLVVACTVAFLPYYGVGAFDALSVFLTEPIFQPIGTFYLSARLFIETGILGPLSFAYFVVLINRAKRLKRYCKSRRSEVDTARWNAQNSNRKSIAQIVKRRSSESQVTLSCPDLQRLSTKKSLPEQAVTRRSNDRRLLGRTTLKCFSVSGLLAADNSKSALSHQHNFKQLRRPKLNTVSPATSDVADTPTMSSAPPIDISQAEVDKNVPILKQNEQTKNKPNISQTNKRKRKLGILVKVESFCTMYSMSRETPSNVEAVVNCIKSVNEICENERQRNSVCRNESKSRKIPLKKQRSCSVGDNAVLRIVDIFIVRVRTIVISGVYALLISFASILFAVFLVLEQGNLSSSSLKNTASASLPIPVIALYSTCLINASYNFILSGRITTCLGQTKRKVTLVRGAIQN